MNALDPYLRWYSESQIKMSLRAMSPVEYRRNLGDALLQREATEYMAQMEITQTERQGLLDWVHGGRSVFENPRYMAVESGRLMDFIRLCVQLILAKRALVDTGECLDRGLWSKKSSAPQHGQVSCDVFS